jgi:ferrous iron transport protein B
MKIALVGNPNSGKTTVFNYLTGQFKKVGNYGGVTVDHFEANLRKKYMDNHKSITIVDLPGTFSLDPSSGDEKRAVDYLKNETIDVILNIVDASQLEQSLHLTQALKELGIPVLIALNKMDIIQKNQIEIDVETLEQMLECQVYCTVATHKRGIQELLQCALNEGCIYRGQKR